jgi:hypothetical protein
MSINLAYSGNSILVYSGEYIILYCSRVTVRFSDNPAPEFQKKTRGDLYLTTHRIIYLNKTPNKSPLRCFSFPFVNICDVELRQPIFCPNYIRGIVSPEAGGGMEGPVKVKFSFASGGAIEYAKALQRAAHRAKRAAEAACYVPPTLPFEGPAFPASESYYNPPQPQNDYGIGAPYEQFPERPPAGSVMVMESPPPYTGLDEPPPPDYHSAQQQRNVLSEYQRPP